MTAPLTRFARPDVCAVFPETSYPGACTSGIRFDWTATGLTGQNTVAIRVTRGGGLSVALGPRTVTVEPQHFTQGYSRASGVLPIVRR